MYLIDTNLIFEVGKGRRCDPKVTEWYQQVGDDELFLSVLVIGEIRYGIERLRTRNLLRALRSRNGSKNGCSLSVSGSCRWTRRLHRTGGA
jgi:predicted nucleic acid-binding protein